MQKGFRFVTSPPQEEEDVTNKGTQNQPLPSATIVFLKAPPNHPPLVKDEDVIPENQKPPELFKGHPRTVEDAQENLEESTVEKVHLLSFDTFTQTSRFLKDPQKPKQDMSTSISTTSRLSPPFMPTKPIFLSNLVPQQSANQSYPPQNYKIYHQSGQTPLQIPPVPPIPEITHSQYHRSHREELSRSLDPNQNPQLCPRVTESEDIRFGCQPCKKKKRFEQESDVEEVQEEKLTPINNVIEEPEPSGIKKSGRRILHGRRRFPKRSPKKSQSRNLPNKKVSSKNNNNRVVHEPRNEAEEVSLRGASLDNLKVKPTPSFQRRLFRFLYKLCLGGSSKRRKVEEEEQVSQKEHSTVSSFTQFLGRDSNHFLKAPPESQAHSLSSYGPDQDPTNVYDLTLTDEIIRRGILVNPHDFREIPKQGKRQEMNQMSTSEDVKSTPPAPPPPQNDSNNIKEKEPSIEVHLKAGRKPSIESETIFGTHSATSASSESSDSNSTPSKSTRTEPIAKIGRNKAKSKPGKVNLSPDRSQKQSGNKPRLKPRRKSPSCQILQVNEAVVSSEMDLEMPEAMNRRINSRDIELGKDSREDLGGKNERARVKDELRSPWVSFEPPKGQKVKRRKPSPPPGYYRPPPKPPCKLKFTFRRVLSKLLCGCKDPSRVKRKVSPEEKFNLESNEFPSERIREGRRRWANELERLPKKKDPEDSRGAPLSKSDGYLLKIPFKNK